MKQRHRRREAERGGSQIVAEFARTAESEAGCDCQRRDVDVDIVVPAVAAAVVAAADTAIG